MKRSILFLIFASFLSTFIIFSQGNDNKNGHSIEKFSLLLPHNSNGIILQGKGADCFIWKTNEPSLITLEPVYDSPQECSSNQKLSHQNSRCSPAVRVIPKQMDTLERKSALVLGYPFSEDEESSETTKKTESIQCEVFIDKITRLEMLTTIRTLEVGVLQLLEIQGFDTENNAFSSLEGVKFDWKVDTSLNGSIALFPLKDLSVAGLSVDKNTKSAKIVARGMRIGSARVQAILSSEASVTTSETFLVLDHFRLLPGRVLYVLPGSEILFELQRQKAILATSTNEKISEENAQFEKIEMPDSRMKWFSSNSTIGKVEMELGNFLASQTTSGKTVVTVKDVTFPMNQISASVYVVDTFKIEMRVTSVNLRPHVKILKALLGNSFALPEYTKYLIENEEYKVALILKDMNNNEITLTKNYNYNINITIATPNLTFVKSLNAQNSEFIIKTGKFAAGGMKQLEKFTVDLISSTQKKKSGISSLFSEKDEKRVLKTEELGFIITPQIKIGSKKTSLHLPINQDFNLSISGGSSIDSYKYIASKKKVLSFTEPQKGSIVLQTGAQIGNSLFIVWDNNNPENGDLLEINIHIPSALKFLEGLREVEQRACLDLEFSVTDAKGIEFDSISNQKISWKVSDSTLFSQITLESSPKTHKLVFCGEKIGFSSVQLEMLSQELRIQSDSTWISVYEPLRIAPSSNLDQFGQNFIISLNSTVSFDILGGPTLWEKPTSILSKIESSISPTETSKISIGTRNIATKKLSVKCKALGDQKENIVELLVNHTIMDPQHKILNTKITKKFTFVCKIPKKLQIVTAQEPKIVMDSLGNLHMRRNQTARLQGALLDDNGHRLPLPTFFGDFALDWTLKHHKAHKNSILDATPFPTEMGTINLIVGPKEEGKLEIHAETKKKSLELEDSVTLFISKDVEIAPKDPFLLLAEKASQQFTATGGSGYYTFSFFETSKSLFLEESRDKMSVTLRPLAVGDIQITVCDALFPSAPCATTTLSIRSIARAMLTAPRHVEVGEDFPVAVRFATEDNIILPASQHRFVVKNITLVAGNEMEEELYKKKSFFGSQTNEFESIFNCEAMKPGILKLAIIFNEKRSEFVEVQIFERLALEPATILMIPGAVYQFKPIGGPFTTFQGNFSIPNPSQHNIGEVHPQSGVFLAKDYGKVTLAAEQNQKIAESHIHVVRLNDLLPFLNENLVNSLRIYEQESISFSFVGKTTDTTVNDGIISFLGMQNPNISVNYKILADSQGIAEFCNGSAPSVLGSSICIFGNTTGTSYLEISAKYSHKGQVYAVSKRIGISVVKRHNFIESSSCSKSDLSCSCHIAVAPNTKINLITSTPNEELHVYPETQQLVTVHQDIDHILLKTGKTDSFSSNLGKKVPEFVILSSPKRTGNAIKVITVENPFFVRLFDLETKRFLDSSNSAAFELPLMVKKSFLMMVQSIDGNFLEFQSIADLGLKLNTNRYSMIDYSIAANGKTLEVTGKDIGPCVLTLSFSKSTKIEYSYNFNVKESIIPSNHFMFEGEKIKFSVSQNVSGSWSSPDAAILKILNPTSGLALAKRGGVSTKIYFEYKTSKTETLVTIGHLESISFQKEGLPPFLTLKDMKDKSEIPLNFHLSNGKILNYFPIWSPPENDVSFKCKSNSGLIDVETLVKLDNNNQYLVSCVIIAFNSQKSEVQKSEKIENLGFQLEISLNQLKKSFGVQATIPLVITKERMSVLKTVKNLQEQAKNSFVFGIQVTVSFVAGILIVFGIRMCLNEVRSQKKGSSSSFNNKPRDQKSRFKNIYGSRDLTTGATQNEREE